MKNVKTKTKIGILIVILLCLLFGACFLLSACSWNTVSVVDIEYAGENGDYIIYTIYYSDGTTSSLSVKNGEDGQSITLKELYDAFVDAGYEGDYATFLAQYVEENVDTSSTITSTQANIYSALNSVVSIYAAFEENVSTSSIFRSTSKYYQVYTGAGVIYYMDEEVSYIITNSHVITSYESTNSNKLPEEVMIYPYGYTPTVKGNVVYLDIDGTKTEYYANLPTMSGGISATVIGYSVDYDLAVLEVSTSDLLSYNSDACAVAIADGYTLAEEVYAIGNPLSSGISVTSGIVSVVSEEISISNMPADNQTHTYRVMRIDAAVYGGNSGGGLFNSSGELVGIVNAGATAGDNYSFALPIDSVVPVVDNLIYYYKTTNSAVYSTTAITMEDLGVTSLTDKYVDFDETTGELIYNVVVGSGSGILYNSGLQEGDIISSIIIDNVETEITHSYQLDDLLLTVRADSIITFVITRNGVTGTTVTIDMREYNLI